MNKILKNSVYGFAVGDALGVPFEFKVRGSFKCTDMVGHGTWNQPVGTWSDDTSMVLATCDSIRENGKIDLRDIMQKFCWWRYYTKYTAHNEVFDIGGTTACAIAEYFHGGISETACGLSDLHSNGNGSLMRILPLAFVDGATEKDVENVSKLTHAHQISVEKCCEFIYFAKNLIKNSDFPIPNYIKDMKEEHVMSSGFVVSTFDAALWCFGTSETYTEAVLKAVNLGGDTDTIAAITGGLAGIKWGYDAIPTGWVDKLANKELIDSCLF